MYEHSVYGYAVKEVFSTHSFNTHQITVITMTNKEGETYQGIAVAPIPYTLFAEATHSEAMGDYGKPLIFEKTQALSFCHFIDGILKGDLPSKISFNLNGLLLSIRLGKYNKNWHGGGAFIGKVIFGQSKIFDLFSKATITKQSLLDLKISLTKLYGIGNDLNSNA